MDEVLRGWRIAIAPELNGRTPLTSGALQTAITLEAQACQYCEAGSFYDCAEDERQRGAVNCARLRHPQMNAKFSTGPVGRLSIWSIQQTATNMKASAFIHSCMTHGQYSSLTFAVKTICCDSPGLTHSIVTRIQRPPEQQTAKAPRHGYNLTQRNSTLKEWMT
jgi:hypothetical protein